MLKEPNVVHEAEDSLSDPEREIEEAEKQVRARRAQDRQTVLGEIATLQSVFEYSLREIDGLTELYTGLRAPAGVISKFLNKQPGAPRDLPGVGRALIHVMASTPTGIARRALLAEHDVRKASAAYYHTRCALRLEELKSKSYRKLVREFLVAEKTFWEVLRRAARVVADARHLMTTLAPAAANDTSRILDLTAVDYLEAQVHIHQARLLREKDPAKKQRFQDGLSLMLHVRDSLSEALAAGPQASEPVDLILAVNALLNAYFVAYEIGDLEGDATFSRARNVAQRIASPLFLRAADVCAKWQNDPRIPFNAASGVGLYGFQQEPAACRLELAAELDKFEGDDIEQWHADWMLEPLSRAAELTEAIKILRKRGLRSRT